MIKSLPTSFVKTFFISSKIDSHELLNSSRVNSVKISSGITML